MQIYDPDLFWFSVYLIMAVFTALLFMIPLPDSKARIVFLSLRVIFLVIDAALAWLAAVNAYDIYSNFSTMEYVNKDGFWGQWAMATALSTLMSIQSIAKGHRTASFVLIGVFLMCCYFGAYKLFFA